MAIYFAEILDTLDKKEIEKIKTELLDLPSKIDKVLDNTKEIIDIAKNITNETNAFYIGRGNDYNIALEGSLKLKEISYIHSEAYPAGELKHGPIALIENDTYVIGIITNSDICEKTLSNLEEVKTRGAKIVLISNVEIVNEDMIIVNIPQINSILAPIVAIIPLQLLAYYIAKNKGLDVDKPRNLAKSVTVE